MTKFVLGVVAGVLVMFCVFGVSNYTNESTNPLTEPVEYTWNDEYEYYYATNDAFGYGSTSTYYYDNEGNQAEHAVRNCKLDSGLIVITLETYTDYDGTVYVRDLPSGEWAVR